MTSPYTALAVL